MRPRTLTILIATASAVAAPVLAKPAWDGLLAVQAQYADKDMGDEEDDDASSLRLRGEVAAEFEREAGSVRVEGASSYRDYEDNGRKDLWTNVLRVLLKRELGPSTAIELSGEAASNRATLEHESADEWKVQARAVYRPTRELRLRGWASYGERRYDDAPGVESQVSSVGADLRYQRGKGTVRADARYEQVESSRSDFDYDRARAGLEYRWAFRPDLEGSLGVEGRRVDYDGRFVGGLPAGGRREDWTVRPTASLEYDPDGPLEMSLDYNYSSRNSNDNLYDRDGQSLMLTLGYRF